jgi:hypothetical protein
MCYAHNGNKLNGIIMLGDDIKKEKVVFDIITELDSITFVGPLNYITEQPDLWKARMDRFHALRVKKGFNEMSHIMKDVHGERCVYLTASRKK